MSSQEAPGQVGAENRDKNLYAVLNLPQAASTTEINERHRSLSLIFHPDKQQDQTLKDVATKQFLEIQKAYQVLSDPFLRQVYDLLGHEGLAVNWPAELRSLSTDELSQLLLDEKLDFSRKKLTNLILPKSKLVCSVDASPLLTTNEVESGLPRILAQNLSYATEKKLNDRTTIIFDARTIVQPTKAAFACIGAVRHQFSPRIITISSVNFQYPYTTKVEATYDDGDNLLKVKSAVLPGALFIPPTLNVTYSRRLFHRRPQRGQLSLQFGPQPLATFFYNTPYVLNASRDPAQPSNPQVASLHGLRFIVVERNFGLVFEKSLPSLVAEAVVIFTELSTRFKATLQYGFTGISLALSGIWSTDRGEIGSTVSIGSAGVALELEFAYLEQRLCVPVVLSTHFSPGLSLGATVLPTSLALLMYQFFVLPRRRAKRKAYFQAMRKNFDEDSDVKKERNAVERLLKDAVKKQARVESSREGLIIEEALYGVIDSSDPTQNLVMDVTVPVQALVRNSQLYISGGETKTALQGFSDPAPFAAKTLGIRYLFRGRMHYGEIPDHLPVVLPLEEHQIM